MKTIKLLFFVCVVFALKGYSQNCIDTISLKGYYISEIYHDDFKIKKADDNPNVTLIQIDGRSFKHFIPYDSISSKKPLSYWLENISKKKDYFFLFSIDKIDIKFLNNECYLENQGFLSKLNFSPFSVDLKTSYRLKGIKHISFKVCYVDASWVKLIMKNTNQNRRMTSSKLVHRNADLNSKYLKLFAFYKLRNFYAQPYVQDINLEIWKE